MADTDLQVKFTADTAGVSSAAVVMQTTLKDIAAQVQAVNASMTSMASAALTPFNASAAGAKAAANQVIQTIQSQVRAQQEAIREQMLDVQQADKEGLISHQQAHSQTLALIAQQQAVAIDAAQAIAAARISADQTALQSATLSSADFIRLLRDEQAANDQANRAMAAANLSASRQRSADSRREAEQYKQQWDQSIGMVTRDFAQGVVQMAEGTKSFSKVMASIGNQILTKFAEVVAKIVSDWIFAEATKTSATQAGFVVRSAYDVQAAQQTQSTSFLTAQKVALNNAVQAASGAYASASTIPLVGWLIAPAAAAAAFSAVEAFGALASAAGGYDIPAGVNPLVQAHASEMILPASIANPLRAQLAAANFNGSSATSDGGAGGGDTHIHNWHLHGVMDGASLRRVLESNRGDHAAAMESLVRSRNGKGFGG